MAPHHLLRAFGLLRPRLRQVPDDLHQRESTELSPDAHASWSNGRAVADRLGLHGWYFLVESR